MFSHTRLCDHTCEVTDTRRKLRPRPKWHGMAAETENRSACRRRRGGVPSARPVQEAGSTVIEWWAARA
jgi:hypothetical protein